MADHTPLRQRGVVFETCIHTHTHHTRTHAHTHTHTHTHHTRMHAHTHTHTHTPNTHTHTTHACTHTHAHTDTHTHTHTQHTHTHHTHTHTHTPAPPLLRLSSPPTHLMPWQCTSPPGSPLCPSPLDTPTCHWSSSPCWSRLSESLSGWQETSLDRCHTTSLGSSPLRGVISSGEGEGCLGNCKATRVYSILLMYFVSECHCLLLLSNQICCVCVHQSEAAHSVSSAHVTAPDGVGGWRGTGAFPLAASVYILAQPSSL